MNLNTAPNLDDPDAFYQALIDMHQGLSPADSQLVNAKLILLLANQIGDMKVLRAAMALARTDIGAAPGDPAPAAAPQGRTA
jgi:hypothetical protein